MTDFVKRWAIRGILNKARELYGKGNTVEEIADKFLAEPKVLEGLTALGIGSEELVKMIKNKVKENE